MERLQYGMARCNVAASMQDCKGLTCWFDFQEVAIVCAEHVGEMAWVRCNV